MQSKKKGLTRQQTPHKYTSSDCIVQFAEGFAGRIKNSRECVQKISKLLKHMKGVCPFAEELALDLDRLETNRVKGHTAKSGTVDYIVGLETNWVLLVEAKLDADKPDHFVKGLGAKRAHSRELITMSDYEVREEKEYVILMKDRNFEQNKDRLKNLACGLPSLIPMKVADFYSEYFSRT